VFIYLPPYGDLRGGAWVVLDSKINAESIEMYADETSHAGVLEPSGLIEVKYRDTEIAQTMHRLDPVCSAIFQQLRGRSPSSDPDGPPSPLYPPETKKEMQQRLRAREELLMPLYRSVATELAALHDTPGRMLAKGAIRGVVEWRHARRFFFHRMLRRKWEGYALRALQCANPTVTLADTRARLSEWSGGLTADAEVAAWCQAHNTALAQNLLEAQQELLATRILAECGATAGSSTSAAPAMLLRVLHHLKASGADVAAIQAWAAAL
jgi:acetyl-CoA carboxylase/biotin carboxylase 1